MTPSLLAALFAPSGQGGSGLSVLLFQVALIFGIFYFLIIRPQRRQQQRHKELLAALQKGDHVITSGGIVGEVLHLKENEITIRSGESKLVVLRMNIANVVNRAEAEKPA
ncbi:MAG: preprotein translocase subunit YajC [Gemmatimonadales bacterium]